MLAEITDKIFYLIYRGHEQEEKLVKYQGYRNKSIVKWKKQSDISWSTSFKILKKLKIYDSLKIRKEISKIVSDNAALFSQPNVFITSFGSVGKSGGMICYEFKHTNLINNNKFKDSWDISTIPSHSTIIFVEDLIGTGTQSVGHINDKLNLLLSPSHNAILLTICATPEGKEFVETNTNFTVITGVLLNESTHQHYSPGNNYFTEKEKREINHYNEKLQKPNTISYDRGLLIAFYYSVPNNSMPIIWKDNFPYKTENGEDKKWFALLPRQY